MDTATTAASRHVRRARWVLLCAGAEAVGMTASAVAARAADDLAAAPALSVIVAGGLVEGTALGSAQVIALAGLLAGPARAAYVVVTVLVAGLGWAAASAPAVLAGDGAGDSPPLALVLLAAGALGAAMGLVLGGAQALVLRSGTRNPGRWVVANLAAWPPAMAVIFAGATTVPATWSTPAVALVGAVTGACAGAVLGGVLGGFAPGLASCRDERSAPG